MLNTTPGRLQQVFFDTTEAEAVNSGARRDRTDDLLNANQALSQLSYGPSGCREILCRSRDKRRCHDKCDFDDSDFELETMWFAEMLTIKRLRSPAVTYWQYPSWRAEALGIL